MFCNTVDWWYRFLLLLINHLFSNLSQTVCFLQYLIYEQLNQSIKVNKRGFHADDACSSMQVYTGDVAMLQTKEVISFEYGIVNCRRIKCAGVL